MKHLAIPLCGLAILLSSCDYDVYQIRLTPQGDSVVRELTVYHVGQGPSEPAPASRPATATASAPKAAASAGSAPTSASAPATQESQMAAEKLAPIQKLYPKSKSATQAARQVFVGEFKGKMPGDVGGAGTYTRLPSELGDGFVYLERFRGNDHPGQRLQETSAAVDQLVDLLIGWFGSELSKEAGYQKLHEYMDKDFRAQLKDLNVFYSVAQADVQAKGANEEFAARAAQYAFESDLVTPQELSAILGLPEGGPFSEAGQRKVLKIFQLKAAQKMGVAPGQPLPKSLSFLDYDNAGDSFDKYVSSTKDFKDFQQKTATSEPLISGTGPATMPTSQPSTSQYMTEKFKPLMPVFGSGDGKDHLAVELVLPAEPLKTNGQWKADTKSVNWEALLSDPAEPVWPRLCYAMWATPNDKAQTKLFGGVILQGDDLLGYCVAHSAMTAEESQKWTQAVSKMSAGSLKDQAQDNETPAQTLLRLLGDFQRQSFAASTQPATSASRP